MANVSCDTCKWWDRIHDDVPPEKRQMGRCRIQPPRGSDGFPITLSGTDWCKSYE